MTETALTPPALDRRTAPLGRLLRSELRFMLRRPRTLIALGVIALVPVVFGVSIAATSGSVAGPGGRGEVGAIAAIVAENGLILPVLTLLLSMAMLLPLVSSMWSADAIAGEASAGALRNLLLAPVSRVRLLAVKAFGVATLCLLAVTLMAVVGILTGLVLLGGNGMLTMSGSTLPVSESLVRIALLVVLVTVQLWGVAAIALAISAATDHPLVVMAATAGGVIVFTVLGQVSALDWLHPVLITTGWPELGVIAVDPLPGERLTEGLLRAACYIAIGYSLASARMATRDG